MTTLAAGKYSKFVVAVLGVISSGLTTWYADQRWVSIVIGVCTALTVYLVPNTSAVPPAAAAPAAAPQTGKAGNAPAAGVSTNAAATSRA